MINFEFIVSTFIIPSLVLLIVILLRRYKDLLTTCCDVFALMMTFNLSLAIYLRKWDPPALGTRVNWTFSIVRDHFHGLLIISAIISIIFLILTIDFEKEIKGYYLQKAAGDTATMPFTQIVLSHFMVYFLTASNMLIYFSMFWK